MHNLAFFRRKLAHRLRNCAARRNAACRGDPTGDDLKVVSLLDRLARDAEQLPQALVDKVAQLCADPAFARRFDQVWDTLADVLGVLLVPASAIDLVQWMIEQARHEPNATMRDADDPVMPAQQESHTPPGSRRVDVMCCDGIVSVANDFTAALAVVGPMLTAWEAATAIGQQRDQAFAASHSATVASVAIDAGRSIVPPVRETLVFTPVGERLRCGVSVNLGNRQADVVGQTLMVVPRSAACEAPLVLSNIGDPATSVVVGLAFLASGLASLKVWTWLQRCRRDEETDVRNQPVSLRIAL